MTILAQSVRRRTPRLVGHATLLAAALTLCGPADAGIKIYAEGDKSVEVGGRVQLQYARVDPDGGPTTDDVLFRRLRTYIQASVSKDWSGKIQIDFGKAIEGDEVAVKDAYMRYLGWTNMELIIGNAKTPFSREFLTSSKRQHTVERGFVGDHNFGTPDRQMGAKLSGHNGDQTITYQAAVGFENHDPDARKVDFDSPANDKNDWNEGVVVAGRFDLHPWGHQKFDQGDFARGDFTANFSLAAFHWGNDDDNNTLTDAATGLSTSTSKADLDEASGLELSAGLRGRGVSLNAEYQKISADTVDNSFTGGVYRAGSTDLDKYQLAGGYMLPGNKVELVGKLESLDADNYADAWDRFELGANYFWNKHKMKAQFTYRHDDNVDGVRGIDQDTIFVQWQFVF